LLLHLLSASVSMRRSAKILKIHRTTVKRKVKFLAMKARLSQKKFLQKINGQVSSMQFDDLITIEHTKLKPLAVTLAVDTEKRFILGAQVSTIPAFGLLAKRSRQKYGRRKSTHKKGLEKLFVEIKDSIKANALIESDKDTTYPPFVKKHFPHAKYETYKGGRGCVAGQGELKKLYFDPLFTLNHTCAILRANINRLVRKTWCTTKDPEMLKNHLDIFIDYYNSQLLS